MQLDDVLDRLERVHKSGNGYVARCPAHEDRAPSLSVTEGDERILVHCHAGCDQDDVLDAIGLSWKDIVYEQTDEHESEYVYTDEGGQPLFRVLRYPGKKFSQQRYEAQEYRAGLNGTRRVLYHLPEVLYGIEQGKTIYLCEGEKDVEALRERGKVATCSPGGASNWRDEYASFLTGAKVLIVQDKDDPGRAYASAVKQSLKGLARKVWIVQAKQGKDAYDHLVTHGLPIEEFQPATDCDELVLPIKSIREFAASVTPHNNSHDYLGPFLHAGQRVHVAGPTGHGKTTFMLEAESAALRGAEFLEWRGRGNLRALHIDLEMPAHLLNRAMANARIEDGLDLLHLPDGLEIDVNQSHRQMIEKAVEGYDIVCIDPWYKLVQNELEFSSVRSVIGLLDGLRKKHPRMCMMVGFHTQEPYEKKQRLNTASISGFKAWHKPADIILTFHRISGNQSRLIWCKDRAGHLGVGVDEEWSLEWSRGHGFERVAFIPEEHKPGVFGT